MSVTVQFRAVGMDFSSKVSFHLTCTVEHAKESDKKLSAFYVVVDGG